MLSLVLFCPPGLVLRVFAKHPFHELEIVPHRGWCALWLFERLRLEARFIEKLAKLLEGTRLICKNFRGQRTKSTEFGLQLQLLGLSDSSLGDSSLCNVAQRPYAVLGLGDGAKLLAGLDDRQKLFSCFQRKLLCNSQRFSLRQIDCGQGNSPASRSLAADFEELAQGGKEIELWISSAQVGCDAPIFGA